MTLLTTTKLAIGSLICTYLLRLVGTFVPSAFRIEQVAIGASGLHLVCGVALLLFFVRFLTEYVEQSRGPLRHATYWAIVGAAVSPLLAFRTLLLIVDPYSLPKALRSPTVEAVLPVAGSVLLMVFFIKLGDALITTERLALKRPTTAAAAGFSVLFVLQTIVLLNFVATGALSWLSNHGGWIMLGLLPIITAVTLAILYFFVSFHRHLARAQDPASMR